MLDGLVDHDAIIALIGEFCAKYGWDYQDVDDRITTVDLCTAIAHILLDEKRLPEFIENAVSEHDDYECVDLSRIPTGKHTKDKDKTSKMSKTLPKTKSGVGHTDNF